MTDLFEHPIATTRHSRAQAERRMAAIVTPTATPLPAGTAWHLNAECLRLPPEWFLEPHGAAYRQEARDACARCVERLTCLDTALANSEESGLWGGLVRSERQAIARQRRQAAP